MQVRNVHIGIENCGLAQYKLRVVKVLHGLNPHIKQEICPTEAFFVTDVLQNWISQIKISCKMYQEEIHFEKLFLKQFELVLAHLTLVTLTFDTKIYRVYLLPRMDVWTRYEAFSSY